MFRWAPFLRTSSLEFFSAKTRHITSMEWNSPHSTDWSSEELSLCWKDSLVGVSLISLNLTSSCQGLNVIFLQNLIMFIYHYILFYSYSPSHPALIFNRWPWTAFVFCIWWYLVWKSLLFHRPTFTLLSVGSIWFFSIHLGKHLNMIIRN